MSEEGKRLHIPNLITPAPLELRYQSNTDLMSYLKSVGSVTGTAGQNGESGYHGETK